MSQESILKEIVAERKRQDEIWGGPRHDDKHTALEWRDFRWSYHNSAASTAHVKPAWSRSQLIKLAALVVAELEARDRKAERKTRAKSAV